jgi:hypothetical protein
MTAKGTANMAANCEWDGGRREIFFKIAVEVAQPNTIINDPHQQPKAYQIL